MRHRAGTRPPNPAAGRGQLTGAALDLDGRHADCLRSLPLTWTREAAFRANRFVRPPRSGSRQYLLKIDKSAFIIKYAPVMRPVSTIQGVPFARVLAPMADVRLGSRNKVLLDI
ncbi:hypothetical protein [Archangium lipolyticum]|uniref:hypothetical protein n=1 Tax=Archangium lipolyticum TaxID=2970465 RepID=UPI002149FE17|nr:hypothetical protein [Archangium lipolyticum]